MRADQPFQRILVGIDADGLAADALVQAASLAGKLDAKLEIVHAVQVPPALWPGVSEQQLAAMHAASLVKARAAALESAQGALESAGMPSHLADVLGVHPGPPAKVILGRAEETQADLIVVGPHRERSMFDFGSTTRAILSRALCPVWHQVGSVGPIQSILVPIDFSEHSRRALEYGHALATRLEASVRVLHSYSPPEFAYSGEPGAALGPTYVIEADRTSSSEELQRWVNDLDWGSVPVETSFVEGMATRALPEEAAKADLVVMGTHGRTGLSRFLLGSVAYTTLKRSEKPVLVVPSHEQSWLLGEG